MKAFIVINTSSGSSDDVSSEISDILQARGHEVVGRFVGTSRELGNCADAIKDRAPELIISLAGDGTVNFLAQLALDIDCALLPLPGGTMNMLAKGLYGSADWRECLEIALSTDTPRFLPFGRTGDYIFLVAAIVGQSVKFQNAREAVREGELAAAVAETLEAAKVVTESRAFNCELASDGSVHPVKALMVTCPHMNAGAREEKLFECILVNELSPLDLIDMGWKALTSDWRWNEHIESHFEREVSVRDVNQIRALVDGEQVTLPAGAKIELVSDALKVLAPS